MKKVLVATDKPFAASALASIKKVIDDAGYELLLLEKYTSQDDLIKAVEPADAIIIRSDIVDRAVIDAAKNLKIVVRAGAGYDNVDLKAASEKGIVVMNTPGQNANAVAELVFGMVLFLIRKEFSGAQGSELRGKTLGIHAYGAVGRFVAEIAQGFGMKVCAFDPFVCRSAMENDGVEFIEDVTELYRRSNFISLHMPLLDVTKKSIGFDLLNLMPKGAVLINTARKEVVDEDGLVKMFESRPDFMYVSDVAPDCKSALSEKFAGRFFFTPKKSGAQTGEANANAGIAAAKQIVAFFEKGDKTFQVNK